MSELTEPAPTASAAPLTAAAPTTSNEPDWTDQVADLVVDTVDGIRDRTTGVAISVSKALVYGIAAAIIGVVALTLVTLLVSRLLGIIPGQIWIPYVAIGAVLVLSGSVCWSKRKPAE